MAGKSWQPSHEPPHRREEGGEKGGGAYDGCPNTPEEMLTLAKMYTNEPKRYIATMHLGPRAHGLLAHACIKMPLTTEG